MHLTEEFVAGWSRLFFANQTSPHTHTAGAQLDELVAECLPAKGIKALQRNGCQLLEEATAGECERPCAPSLGTHLAIPLHAIPHGSNFACVEQRAHGQ